MAGVKVQNVYQVTRDMEGARSFYRDVLGMTVRFEDPGKWCQLDAGGANFALAAPGEAPPGAAGTVVVFEVEDLEAARRAVEQAGLPTEAIRDMGGHGRVFTCRDPDGTVIQLFQRSRG